MPDRVNSTSFLSLLIALLSISVLLNIFTIGGWVGREGFAQAIEDKVESNVMINSTQNLRLDYLENNAIKLTDAVSSLQISNAILNQINAKLK